MEFIIKFNQFMQASTPYLLSLYALLIIPIVLLAIRESRKRKVAKLKLMDAIKKILASESENISYKSLMRIGKGYYLKDFQVHSVITEMYSQLAGDVKAKKIEGILDDIEKIEPYKALPEDLKPALIQIEKQIELANKDSSPLLLQPLKSHLIKYSELIEERDNLKKKSRRNTLITIGSAFVGLFGLVGTLTSPSVADIENLLQKNLNAQTSLVENESNKAINRN